MIDLLDEELVEVMQIACALEEKYGRKEPTAAVIEAIKAEATKRYEEAGFRIKLSLMEWLVGLAPFSIEIEGRIEPVAFDYEKKGWEVRKALERKEEIYRQSDLDKDHGLR